MKTMNKIKKLACAILAASTLLNPMLSMAETKKDSQMEAADKNISSPSNFEHTKSYQTDEGMKSVVDELYAATQKLKEQKLKDEQTFKESQEKNLCLYSGNLSNESIGAGTVVKHQFCCFSNMLDKVIQVEGRKQLHKDFGIERNPDCSGLTLEEIRRIDFSKLDFSEFIEDYKARYLSKMEVKEQQKTGGHLIGDDSETTRRLRQLTNLKILKGLSEAMIPEVGGYATLMALKTVCPQCENMTTYLEQMQRSVNQFNINGSI